MQAPEFELNSEVALVYRSEIERTTVQCFELTSQFNVLLESVLDNQFVR